MSGNAENGIDYEILSEQMIFYEGTQEAKIEILPLCDGLDEEVENIIINFETLNESFEIDLINNSDCSIYQGTNVSDSLALVQFYNDNQGENWNNNINNLDDALIFATTEEINLDGNALEFDDLEPFAELDNISYQNQALIGEDIEIELNEGESAEFVVNTSGEYNLYTWFKNGEPIFGELTSTLSLDNLDEDDEAIYNCEVNNSLITDLTITSALFDLDVVSDISIEENEEILIFYPNPSNEYIYFPEINMDRYEIYNISGKLINSSIFDNRIDVSMLTSGQYVIKLISTKRVITKKFTKL